MKPENTNAVGIPDFVFCCWVWWVTCAVIPFLRVFLFTCQKTKTAQRQCQAIQLPQLETLFSKNLFFCGEWQILGLIINHLLFIQYIYILTQVISLSISQAPTSKHLLQSGPILTHPSMQQYLATSPGTNLVLSLYSTFRVVEEQGAVGRQGLEIRKRSKSLMCILIYSYR